MSQSTQFWPFILVGLLAACTPQTRPTPSPPITRNPSIPTSPDSTRASARTKLSIYQPGSTRYAFQLQSVVQSVIGDSVPRVDSSRLTAIFSANYTPVPQSRFIRAFVATDSVTVSTLSAPVTAPLVLPNQSYSLDIDPLSGKVTVGRTVQTCSQEMLEGPFHGDEVTPAIPANSAQSWTDTSTYSGCRGGVSLRFTRVSNYRRDTIASSQTGEPLVRVFRVVDVVVTGFGSQWQQAVQATGHGTSTDTLTIRMTPPRLQSVSGSGRLELLFKSALRSQQFLQATTSQITAQPDTR